MIRITIATKRTVTPQCGDICIGRLSPLGNSFVLGRDGDRGQVMARYRTWLDALVTAGWGNAAYDELQRLVAPARWRPAAAGLLLCSPALPR